MKSSRGPRIFLVGSERSGSNLLRSLVGNHSQVEAPVAPHFFDSWRELVGLYGDLRNSKNVSFLMQDMLEFANHTFNDWALEVDVEKAVADHAPTSFWDVFDVLYQEKAKSQGKKGYACKGNHIFNYAFQVKAHWPEAKFLYLVRDPRDHCASWKRNPMHLKTVWDMVGKWKNQQRICRDLVRFHGVDMHVITYEDLIADPPQIMARALNYCGLEVEESCFQTDGAKQKATAERFVYWENLDKPILRGNKGKYRTILSPEEINLIESQVGDYMEEFGYEKETSGNWTTPSFHGFRLRMERKKVERDHKEHYEKEMSILRSKVQLRKEIKSRAARRRLV